MKTIWRRLSDRREIDLVPYIKNWITENPDHKIYIGCDSHNHYNITTFAVVIVLHYTGLRGGGHVLYHKVSEPRIKSRPDRLWKEVQMSVECAQILIDNEIEKPDYIDIDLNPDPKYQSNTVLRAAVGLIESIGVKARYKTLSPWAISIADHICK